MIHSLRPDASCMSTRELGKRRVAMATMGLLAATGVGTGAVAILAGHGGTASQATTVTSGTTGSSSTSTSNSSPSTSGSPTASSTSSAAATSGGS
jgi:hypothetical protein